MKSMLHTHRTVPATLIASMIGRALAFAMIIAGVAMVFVGGAEYSDVQSRLWTFAVLGTLLSMLQLLVYSVLARQGTRSTYFARNPPCFSARSLALA